MSCETLVTNNSSQVGIMTSSGSNSLPLTTIRVSPNLILNWISDSAPKEDYALLWGAPEKNCEVSLPSKVTTSSMTPLPLELFIKPDGHNQVPNFDQNVLNASLFDDKTWFFQSRLAAILNDEQAYRAWEIIRTAQAIGSVYLSDEVIVTVDGFPDDAFRLLSQHETGPWHLGLPVWFEPYAERDRKVRNIAGKADGSDRRLEGMRAEVQHGIRVQVSRIVHMTRERERHILRAFGAGDETLEILIDKALAPIAGAFNANTAEAEKRDTPVYDAVYANSKEALRFLYGDISAWVVRKEMEQEARSLSVREITRAFEIEFRQLTTLVHLWEAVDAQRRVMAQRVANNEKYIARKSDLDARPNIRQPTVLGLLNDTARIQRTRPSVNDMARAAFSLGITEAWWAYPSLQFLQPLLRAAAFAGQVTRHAGSDLLDDYRVAGGLLALGWNTRFPEVVSGIDPELIAVQNDIRKWISSDGFKVIDLANNALQCLVENCEMRIDNREFKRRYLLQEP
ncbi:hypothetical protein R2A130_3604 [Ahrensia sp. R2A130]|nr:hypothetical protein R2A130_3604 [Ahrensia sp. R2A130]